MYKKNLISKIRKSTALVLSAVLMFSMAACGKENVKGSINDKTTEAAVTWIQEHISMRRTSSHLNHLNTHQPRQKPE